MTIETKLFELRDEATFIPVIACLMRADETNTAWGVQQREEWLLRRAGYSESAQPLVLLTRMDGGGRAEYDPFAWGGRTFPVAHEHIEGHWNELSSGALIDVRVLLGEQREPCASEQEDCP